MKTLGYDNLLYILHFDHRGSLPGSGRLLTLKQVRQFIRETTETRMEQQAGGSGPFNKDMPRRAA